MMKVWSPNFKSLRLSKNNDIMCFTLSETEQTILGIFRISLVEPTVFQLQGSLSVCE